MVQAGRRSVAFLVLVCFHSILVDKLFNSVYILDKTVLGSPLAKALAEALA
jgi:hypothetical protein